MTRLIKAVAMCLMLLSSLEWAHADSVEIDIDATLVSSEPENTRIRFRVTNRSGKDLTFNEGFLPWGVRGSLILVAVRSKVPYETLASKWYRDDLGSRRVTLKDAGSLDGIVSLNSYLADLEKELRKGSVVVLWSYELVLSEHQRSRRFGGAITIPRAAAR